MSARLRERGDARLYFTILVFLLSFAATIFRLFDIQVVQAKKFEELAKSQRVRTVSITGKRGDIFDRNGNLLATSIEAFTIYANPLLIKDPKTTASKLTSIINLDENELINRLSKKNGFVYLIRKTDQATAKRVESLSEVGIYVMEESKRYYPSNDLAATVIGFAGVDNEGLSGLENYYDDILSGESIQLTVERDPNGRNITTSTDSQARPKDGKNLILTIDKEIQHKAQFEIDEAVKKFGAKSGNVIALDPTNGEILALANSTSFDLNQYSKFDAATFRNRAIVDSFEPGSTIKLILASAALEEETFSVNDKFTLPYSIQVADKIIKDSHERGTEEFTFSRIITDSSNVGAVKIGEGLGKDNLYKYLIDFGFSKKTRVDFPGEATGFVPPPDKWYGSAIGNIPFGQGISATSLQVIQAVAAIANEGTLTRPHFVKEVTEASGDPVGRVADSGKKAISARTAAKIGKIMEETVLSGTGVNAKLVDYRVCGKTGTAQKPSANGLGYEKGKYVASFVGYAPADDPRVAIIVVLDEPKDSIYGGTVAAPVFKNLAEFTLRRLKAPPN
ncbi:MAG: penicillin-binding protein 2 [Actinomycetota bacterium]|nr:penicillin-binding protein 2 [Actinomycetota bacterium]